MTCLSMPCAYEKQLTSQIKLIKDFIVLSVVAFFILYIRRSIHIVKCSKRSETLRISYLNVAELSESHCTYALLKIWGARLVNLDQNWNFYSYSFLSIKDDHPSGGRPLKIQTLVKSTFIYSKFMFRSFLRRLPLLYLKKLYFLRTTNLNSFIIYKSWRVLIFMLEVKKLEQSNG